MCPVGRMLMFHQMFIIFGVLFSYAFGLITTYPIMIGVCTVWPTFHMLTTFYLMPESPYYMYKLRYGRDEIEKIMRLIKGQKYDVASDYNDMQVIQLFTHPSVMFIVLFSVQNIHL